jgi:hypothetical protein
MSEGDRMEGLERRVAALEETVRQLSVGATRASPGTRVSPGRGTPRPYNKP